MFAGFLAVIPQTPPMVLIICRPDYRGALAPLDDSEITALVAELLGRGPYTAWPRR